MIFLRSLSESAGRKFRRIDRAGLPKAARRGTISALNLRFLFLPPFLFLLLTLGLFTASPIANAEEAADIVAPADRVESHRLRIVNEKEGAIQVSYDKGETWRLIGRVLAPAKTCAEGFLAVQYAKPGTVVAIAVHGLRIRTGGPNPNVRDPFTLTIEPQEYATAAAQDGKRPNQGFGGHVGGASGIYTDIPAGSAIFRELAPRVGSPVFLEQRGRCVPLPVDFLPSGAGEAIIIPVFAPKNALISLTLENKNNGAVEATYADGSVRQVCRVVDPVQGVGRFDGTAFTGVGRINTAHTGVITVSTAPFNNSRAEGAGAEQRGGFQICPAWHNSRTQEAGAPMILTLGPPGKRRRSLEGAAPLFRDFIPLDNVGANVEISVDDGPFEPMPMIVGFRRDAFTGPGLTSVFQSQGISRAASRGVTAFRITLPEARSERIVSAANAAAVKYRQRRLSAARAGQTALVNGVLSINANPTNAVGVAYVRIMVEGTPRGISNVAPYQIPWDTTRVADGEYLLQADAFNADGAIIATTRRRVYVLNPPTPKIPASDDSPAAGS